MEKITETIEYVLMNELVDYTFEGIASNGFNYKVKVGEKDIKIFFFLEWSKRKKFYLSFSDLIIPINEFDPFNFPLVLRYACNVHMKKVRVKDKEQAFQCAKRLSIF